MAKFTGVCIIKMDGATLRTKPGASLDFGGVNRTTQMANGSPEGYTEAGAASKVSGTILHGSDTDVAAIQDAVDVTLIFQCDSGPEYMVRSAHCTAPPVLTGGDGDLAVEFEGKKAELV